MTTKTIGILAHSYEGGALCFLTACREGMHLLGPHMHPSIVLSAIPMALSMDAWERYDLEGVGVFLRQGAEQLARAGADFFVCPDNTAHLSLERTISTMPLPGLHIAHVVCDEIVKKGWKKVALLGTRWTMNGEVYTQALASRGLLKMIPDESSQAYIHNAIFDELCLGKFNRSTIEGFIAIINQLKEQGAECVILGCTEIPLIISPDNSPLPTLDSTRLLASYAVRLALTEMPIPCAGWIEQF